MVTHITNENYESVLKGAKPVVIDVFATWCGPCKQMKPHFEALAEELGDAYTFADLNVDEAHETAARLEVNSVPTIIVMRQGKEVSRNVGYMTKEDLKKFIEES